MISSPFGSVNRVGPVAHGITKFSNGTLRGIDRESASSRSASLKEWEMRPRGENRVEAVVPETCAAHIRELGGE